MALHKKILEKSKKFISSAQKTISQSKTKKKMPTIEFSFPDFLELEKEAKKLVTEISLLSAIKIIAVIFGVILVGEFLKVTADIIISFFLALFISSALYPGVHFLEQKKIPRGFSIGIIFIGVIGVFIFLISTLFPAIIDQVIALAEWVLKNIKLILYGDFSPLPHSLEQYGPDIQKYIQGVDTWMRSLETDQEAQKGLLQTFSENISKFDPWKEGITSFIKGLFSFLGNFFLIMLLSFFILFDRESLQRFFLSFFSPKAKNYMAKKSGQMQEKIAQWIHGQMILFLFMGGATWIVLSLLGVDYALTLGFLTGLAEFMPYVGPILAFCVSAPIAFGGGYETGLAVVIFFFILQTIEGNILVPLVMKKAVGIPPLVAILAMLIGFQFLGVMGAVMAIPIASIIGIFILDIQHKEEDFFDSTVDETNENTNENTNNKTE